MEGAMTSAVSPEQIVKELHQLWISLAGAKPDEAASAIVRACSMTLLVATEETGESTPAGEVLAAIMRDHPSRAIDLRVVRDEERKLDHQVLAQCWKPFGNQQQICSEQIEIKVSPDMIPDVAALLPGLLVPDLPVALWCRSGNLLKTPEFRLLIPIADKLIFDSSEFPDPHATVTAILAGSKNGCLLGDLNWARLTRWREAIAQAFETPASQAAIKDLSDLAIGYKTPSVPVTALYLAAWVEHVLGRPIRTRFHTVPAAVGRTIEEVVLSGPGITVAVARTAGNSVQVHINSVDSRAVFPPHAEYQLVGEELSLLEPDPVFEDVLRRAHLSA
jgi:glucose-6-phosphate dehydrogenase assembly protein OpcA